MYRPKLLLTLTLSGLLTACGGGGGGGSNPPKPASSTAPASSVAPSSTAISSTTTISSIAATSSLVAVSSSLAFSSVAASAVSSTASSSVAVVSSEANLSSSSSSSLNQAELSISKWLVVDQFGYLPDAQKIAVIRDPQLGHDMAESFTPSANLSLVNLTTGETVFTAAPAVWNSGATHSTSGDKAWWFDFSSITTPGTYAVVDNTQKLRSAGFKIAADVYKPVLKHAFRTFFYQRAGFAKSVPFAEAAWADSASHLGACQDKNSRLYTAQSNAATEKDLSGGWYDAGDFNKYTNWHADYIINLLHAYLENPAAWGDDFNIPESANGISDLIDEVKWGFDWLKKMQNNDGSLLSIQGLQGASPPSAATGCSYYGPASTSATFSGAAAFALGAKVFATLGVSDLNSYADDLKVRAENAWAWGNANPAVIVDNNTGVLAGLGAGNQEVDNAGRALKKTRAAIYLFAATGSSNYQTHVTANYNNRAQWVDIWRENELMSWLYYANLSNADTSLATNIKAQYATSMNDASNLGAITNKSDAYRAYLGDSNFTWGSNRSMSRKGTSFYNLISYSAGTANPSTVKNAALGYLNYLHGTNTQAMVYLSNMYSLGIQSSVNEFYHSWFADKSPAWDRVNQSSFGPAPGFLVGGPNPSYDWDSCCPNSCGSTANNNVCTAISITPPKGQPPMKSYLDFNTSWPLNSWQISENHNDYQVAYLRLLSKFVANP